MKKRTQLIVALLVVLWGLFLTAKMVSPQNSRTIVDCLVEQNVTMYGADSCPYCKHQKKLLGNSFDKINYVNCETDETTCMFANIKGYPTWEIHGEFYEGLHKPDELALLAGCES